MLVFSKAKLVFLSVPKTGTTAYQAALGPHASMVVSDPPELKHAPVFRYNRFFRPALEKFIGPDLEVIAVMREPVSWLGSWYRYRQRPAMRNHPNSTAGMSFDAFVEGYLQGKRPGFANVGSQAKFMEPQKNGTAVTRLFRYEDQRALTAFLEDRLGCRVETPVLNASPRAALELSRGVETRLRRKCAAEFALHDSIHDDGRYTPPEIGSVG
ncbi:gamma-glutamyl kinase [Roseovarius sp. SCSIO 43702]|uniref:gamma-glutamyl kinase n=1 Tax=Roseovarius sp. SCSIO 43702 TaxID=2823043 RepID=UPI001C736AE6|nr:gamma-glutamyl kinase [Roseovarius sp. SCSIO 43702]QYX58387.1 gamma-glutamyl kinase [Roseovarius sp. SCSIO 43702]